jgi:hypothetical protein
VEVKRVVAMECCAEEYRPASNRGQERRSGPRTAATDGCWYGTVRYSAVARKGDDEQETDDKVEMMEAAAAAWDETREAW